MLNKQFIFVYYYYYYRLNARILQYFTEQYNRNVIMQPLIA